jgi:homoserine kinase
VGDRSSGIQPGEPHQLDRGPDGAAVRVSVPATSANLGPGFDTLGLAVELRDELTLRITTGGLVVNPYVGDGGSGIALDETNLVVRAARRAFDATGGQPAGLQLSYRSHIPHSRGLGSSSAAICAGVAAALAVRGADPAGELALDLAAEIEGHPDNVAPCLLGGATIAFSDGRATRAVRLEPAEQLEPVLFVPTVRTSTSAARAALPEMVPHRDAAFAAGRAALLVAALTSRPELLFAATEDRLHQPFRLPAVPISAALFEALRSVGVPAVLSGSGPTVLALCRDGDEANRAVRIAGDVTPAGAVTVLRPGLASQGVLTTDVLPDDGAPHGAPGAAA